MSISARESDPAPTVAERVYQALRGQIGSGELEPGVKVTERGLAERMGVSPTPVREAIRRLEADGLVERVGPRTTVVARIEEDAAHDLAEVEVALRGLAARFAARHATDEELDALDRLLDEADDLVILIRERHRDGRSAARHADRFLDVLGQFNEQVNASAHNPVLVRLLQQSRSLSPSKQREITRAHLVAGDEFGADRYAEHRGLVRALRAREAAEAERIVTDHAARGLLDLRREL
jgi:DNA-binding GntR family transcriptional regulator